MRSSPPYLLPVVVLGCVVAAWLLTPPKAPWLERRRGRRRAAA